LSATLGQTAAMRAPSNGIEIEYETFGDPADPALLLVMGFTAQLTSWDEAFCRMLADRGRFVIRFDNRDVGLSTKFDGVEVDMVGLLGALAARDYSKVPAVPYTLSAFSDDAFGLLDHLGIERAHIAGASMGGMIVQTMAIEHPERVLTMTSIMSTTGNPDVGQAKPEATAALLAPPPADRAAYVEAAATNWRVFASPRYFDAAKAKERAAASYDRSFYPAGGARQLAAILASGDRTERLQALAVPTLVIHGRADTLITLSGGEATAAAVPGANLLVCNDMGHDLPEPLWPAVVDAIVSHTTHAIG
jgi:pimeloyl-ACP methyl ester carboxylesterase